MTRPLEHMSFETEWQLKSSKLRLSHRVFTPGVRRCAVQAKKYGYDQCGILMPNAYFDDLTSWGRHMDHLVELVKTSPFEARDGATKGCFDVTSTRVFSDQWYHKTHAPYETLKRDDHPSQDMLKL